MYVEWHKSLQIYAQLEILKFSLLLDHFSKQKNICNNNKLLCSIKITMTSFSECEPLSSLSVYVLKHLQPMAYSTKQMLKKNQAVDIQHTESKRLPCLKVLWPLPPQCRRSIPQTFT